MNIVLGTNILVSAVWSPGRNVSDILNAAFARKLTVCYDYQILEEYDRVLHYPKLKCSEWEINSILDPLIKNGISVIADSIPTASYERDETDRKFYKVAKFCHAVLVSRNLALYPSESDIMSPTDFCRKYL